MPFKSKAQQKWMYANEPEMAERWSAHTSDHKSLPEKVKKKRKKKAGDALATAWEAIKAPVAAASDAITTREKKRRKEEDQLQRAVDRNTRERMARRIAAARVPKIGAYNPPSPPSNRQDEMKETAHKALRKHAMAKKLCDLFGNSNSSSRPKREKKAYLELRFCKPQRLKLACVLFKKTVEKLEKKADAARVQGLMSQGLNPQSAIRQAYPDWDDNQVADEAAKFPGLNKQAKNYWRQKPSDMNDTYDQKSMTVGNPLLEAGPHIEPSAPKKPVYAEGPGLIDKLHPDLRGTSKDGLTGRKRPSWGRNDRRTLLAQNKQAGVDNSYPLQNIGVQQFAPLDATREFSDDEKKEIAEEKSHMFPKIFKSYKTPATELLSSPGKQSILAAILAGGAGAAGGAIAGMDRGSWNDAGDFQPAEFGTGSAIGAGIGGLGMGGLAALLTYFGRKQRNEDVEDLMSRLPEGATRRDLLTDPVYQRDLDRKHMAIQSGGRSGGDGALLAAALSN